MKRVFSFLLCLTMVFSLAVPASAVGGSVSFQYGSGSTFKVTPGDENYTSTDLFGSEFKNVMPGDNLTQTITIKNNCYKYDYIKVYMKAVPHSAESDLTYDRDKAEDDGKRDDETVKSMKEFLSQMDMQIVVNGSKEIFDASPDETDGLTGYVRLATLNRFKTAELTVTLNVPIEMDNEFANRVGEVDWVFYVEGFNNPAGSNPKTGDMIMIAVAVMAVSAAAIVLLVVAAKKKKKK